MTPDPKNLYVGAGNVFFDRFDANGNSTGFKHVGNADEMHSSINVDKVTKKSSMSGARGTLAEVITGTTAEIGITLGEFDPSNIALALLGDTAAFTQVAVTATDASINGGSAIELDKWYDLGSLKVTVTTVKQGATTLNAGAYQIDADAGMICFLSSYGGVNPATAAITTWTGTAAVILTADKKAVVHALSVGKIVGRLRYVSAADQSAGPRMVVDVWNVSLTPDGDLALIGSDFATFKFKGACQADATKPVGQQYIRAVYL